MKLAAPILAALILAGCGDVPADDVEQDIPGIGSNGRRDLADVGPPMVGRKGGLTYPEYDAIRDRRGSGRAFADYGCMDQCDDVRSGYEEAARLKVISPNTCSGSTWGAVEGCVAFTQGMPAVETKLPPLDS